MKKVKVELLTIPVLGSQIYKDARAIQKIIKGKKSELEAQKAAKENRGSRVTRGRLDKNKKHYTAEVSCCQSEIHFVL